MTQAGQELGRQQRWAEAVAAGRVHGLARGRRGHGRRGRRPRLEVPLTARPGWSGAGRRGVRHAVRDRPVGVGAGDGRAAVIDRGAGAGMKVALVTEGTYPRPPRRRRPRGATSSCAACPRWRSRSWRSRGRVASPPPYLPPSNVAAVRRIGLWARRHPAGRSPVATVDRFAGAYAQLFESVLRGGPQAAGLVRVGAADDARARRRRRVADRCDAQPARRGGAARRLVAHAGAGDGRGPSR